MKNKTAKRSLAPYAMVPFAIVFSGTAIFAYQSYFWFMRGYWKPLKAYLLLDRMLPAGFVQWQRNSAAMSKAVTYTCNLPLAWFLIISGLLLLLLLPNVFNFHCTSATNEPDSDHWRR